MSNQTKLSANAETVLKAIYQDIDGETGGEFGFSDGIMRELPAGVESQTTPRQLSGYCSGLQKKGLYASCEYESEGGGIAAVKQTYPTKAGIAHLKTLGIEYSWGQYIED